MSTLTKILVVVFVVLAMFATTVFIQYVNTTANYRQWGQDQAGKAAAAQAQAVRAQQELNALTVQRDQAVNSLRLEIEALKTELDKTKSDLTKANQDLAVAQSNQQVMQARQTNLTTLVQEMEKVRGELNSQLEAANKRVRDLQSDYLQTEQALKETQQKADQLELAKRVADEQAEEYKRQIRDLQSKLADAAQGLPITADAVGVVGDGALLPAKIDGTVQAVRGNLASLNVGSADGVTRGTTFTLHRGEKWVGTLQVQDVDANSSAGILIDVQMTPVPGDKASTRLK